MQRTTGLLLVYALPLVLLVAAILKVCGVVLPWYVFVVGIPLAVGSAALVVGSIALSREEALIRASETTLAASIRGVPEYLVMYQEWLAAYPFAESGVEVIGHTAEEIRVRFVATGRHDRPVARAARVAREIVVHAEAVFGDHSWLDDGPRLKVGAGISTGVDAAEMAPRLAAAAGWYCILLGEPSRSALTAEEARELGCQRKHICVPGLAGEVTVYLVGVSASPEATAVPSTPSPIDPLQGRVRTSTGASPGQAP